MQNNMKNYEAVTIHAIVKQIPQAKTSFELCMWCVGICQALHSVAKEDESRVKELKEQLETSEYKDAIQKVQDARQAFIAERDKENSDKKKLEELQVKFYELSDVAQPLAEEFNKKFEAGIKVWREKELDKSIKLEKFSAEEFFNFIQKHNEGKEDKDKFNLTTEDWMYLSNVLDKSKKAAGITKKKL
jgi:hypothetical protein